MKLRRPSLLLVLSGALLHVAPACVGGEEIDRTNLNPQPLPPAKGDDQSGDPTAAGGPETAPGSGGSSGTGTPPTATPASNDAGAGPDASDAGDGG